MPTGQSPNLVFDAGAGMKCANLRRMKSLALALLIAMLVLLAVSAVLGAAYPWLTWVHAFAEAAAVGVIADWFAVTALFRHPLGLPIPHTAIIPNNKNKIGASLGNFVEHNFVTPENVMRKLEQRNLARHRRMVGSYGQQQGACSSRQRDDSQSARSARGQGRPTLSGANDRGATRAGRRGACCRRAANNRHQALLDHGLQAIESWMTENRGLIEAKFSEASKYTPGFFDKYVVNRFEEGVIALLHEVANSPQHEVRARFNEAIAEFVINLKTSPEFRQRGETLKRDLLAHLSQDERYYQLWIEIRDRILNDLASERSILREHLSGALMAGGCTAARHGTTTKTQRMDAAGN